MKRFLSAVIDLLSRLPEFGLKSQLRDILYQDVISERIFEYPLTLRLLNPNAKRVLDVGCRYSNLVIQLASLGHEVTGIDLEPYPYSHPNLKFQKADIRKTQFKSGYFDAVTAISTIEHIGLGYYEMSTHPDITGDQKCVNEIYRLLSKKGQLLFSAPFGLPTTTASYRVYSQENLRTLFNRFTKKEYFYFEKKNGYWIPCSPTVASRIDSSSQVNSVVYAVCVK